MWTFVDNISMLVIHHTLLNGLAHVLSPTNILQMDDATINLLAAEPVEQQDRRETLQEELKMLSAGLQKCKLESMVASQVNTSHQACANPSRGRGPITTRQSLRAPTTPNRSEATNSRGSPNSINVFSQSQCSPGNLDRHETPMTSEDEDAGNPHNKTSPVPRLRLNYFG